MTEILCQTNKYGSKDVAINRASWISKLLLFLLAGFCQKGFAQEDASLSVQESAPAAESSTSEASGFRSFFDSISGNVHNNLGFTFGVNEMYSSNRLGGDSSKSAQVTAFEPRLFANIGRRKSRLHFDMGGGYRLYRKYHDLDNTEGAGNLAYSYQASRRVGIQVSDRASSMSNDLFSSFTSVLETPTSNPDSSFVLMFNQRRITQNLFESRIEFRLSRKSTLGFFANYQIYRNNAEQSANFNLDGVQAGFNYEHELAKWLYMTSSWSTYINDVSAEFQDTKIYRLEAGGFHFKLGRSWDLSASGGADILDAQNYSRRVDGTVRAKIAHNARTNTVYVSYQRSFASAKGVRGVFQSDLLTAGLGQRITRRLNFQMRAVQNLSKDAAGTQSGGSTLVDTGSFRSYDVTSSLDIAVLPGIVAIVSYKYQNQKNTIPFFSGIEKINRYIASFGLQYMWPSSRR